MIEWKEEYSTGMLDLDAQHKILFKYVNNLEEIILSEGYSEVRVSNILDYLNSYGKNHFHYEEKCMIEKHCPVAAQNKSAHEKFLHQFAVYQERFKKEGATPEFVKDVYHWTQTWFIDHVCKIDIHLHACVAPNTF